MTEKTDARRTFWRRAVLTLVNANIIVFAALAFTGRISGAPETIVFIDFWGRFVVYSLWFVGYALYRHFLDDRPMLQNAIIALVSLNIPLFLILSYLDKVKVTPENLAIIDFWGGADCLFALVHAV